MQSRTAPLAISLVLALAAAGACSSIEREVARDKKVDQDMAVVTANGVPGATIVIRDGGSTSKVAHGL